MKPILLVAAAIIALPVSAQPTSGPSAPESLSGALSAALDASVEAVVHHGEVVLLWEALPGAAEFIVEASRPDGPSLVTTRVAASPEADAVGYSARLDLPDGAWSVRVRTAEAFSSRRALHVEAPDAFGAEPRVELYATRD